MGKTKFKQAVEIIAKSYESDCVEYDCTIRELFKIWQCDSSDLKEEFLYILNTERFDGEFTDDCEIIDDNGEIKTLRQLIKAVKDFEF